MVSEAPGPSNVHVWSSRAVVCNENGAGEGKKKSEILGGPAEGGPAERRSHFGSSHFLSRPPLLQRFVVSRTFGVPETERRGCMPRKGRSTVQVPDGWLQVIRGPRPQSVKWPAKAQQKSDVRVRDAGEVRDPQVAQQVRRVQRGPQPEEVLSNARARVTKLEAAMAAVDSPTQRTQGCQTP